jgi:hypothetical protein
MPNHCQNTFTMKGDKKSIAKLLHKCLHNDLKPALEDIETALTTSDEKGDDFINNYIDKFCLFKGLKPVPEELQNTVSPPYDITDEVKEQRMQKYAAIDWYGWCNLNWGTKWGCYDSYLKEVRTYNQETTISIEYSTAWSPGDDFLLKELSVNEYSNLSFHLYYMEPGVGFHGFFLLHEGKVIAQDSGDFNKFPTSMPDAMEHYLYW